MRIREGAHRDCRHFERAKTAANSRSDCSPCTCAQLLFSNPLSEHVPHGHALDGTYITTWLTTNRMV